MGSDRSNSKKYKFFIPRAENGVYCGVPNTWVQSVGVGVPDDLRKTMNNENPTVKTYRFCQLPLHKGAKMPSLCKVAKRRRGNE